MLRVSMDMHNLIVMCSPTLVASKGIPDHNSVQRLKDIVMLGYPVSIISNHDEPRWFRSNFGSSKVDFLKIVGRQNGDFISEIAKKLSLKSYDVLVLAITHDDIRMCKNGNALLIVAGWSNDERVRRIGLYVNNLDDLKELTTQIAEWPSQWWVITNTPLYGIRALADLSSYGQSSTQQIFANKLKDVVKNGGNRLNALLAVTARSLLSEEFEKKNLVFGVYPSSNSDNDDNEILSDFTRRLRTTISLVRNCKKGEPLFIRHLPSIKRSADNSAVRTDPSDQIETIHLNPHYRMNDQLVDKHVIVIDDCTTYGVSFGVAAAFLRKAGAIKVTGVALGKFGDQLRYYDIDIDSDPYAPIKAGDYKIKHSEKLLISPNYNTQIALRTLIP